MKKVAVLLSLVLSVGAVSVAEGRLTKRSQITTRGLGSVVVGMTRDQAERAAGKDFRLRGEPRDRCRYALPESGPRGVAFMLVDGVVARVDVSRPTVATVSGVRVGDTEGKVYRTYEGRTKTTRHKFARGGHYIEFVPRDRAERTFRVVFEIRAQKVDLIRAGRLPEVRFAEGCS